MEGAALQETLREMTEGSVNGASLSLSLWELCEGKLEGGLLY
jgi:hypothetical protein